MLGYLRVLGCRDVQKVLGGCCAEGWILGNPENPETRGESSSVVVSGICQVIVIAALFDTLTIAPASPCLGAHKRMQYGTV